MASRVLERAARLATISTISWTKFSAVSEVAMHILKRGTVLVAGIALCAGTLLTGASMVEVIRGTTTVMKPSDLVFNVSVAGAEGVSLIDSLWSDPTASEQDVALRDDDTFEPGTTRTFTLGAKIVSTDGVGGLVNMTILNPRPQPGRNLFDVMEFTVIHDGVVLAQAVPGAEVGSLTDIPLGLVAADNFTTVRVDILLPDWVGNEYQGLTSSVSVKMQGINQ
ncbi:hypothetical protein [Lysinibacter sp. HNR]|uniref:hypothetical protein n=1 Tax=Lysinibacter sp. HNR TaxID=3031408 RepID=UPI0024359CAE|nr:hypothetical protein [Lysinibacter sp. HNR]WGD37212.1 hypothetical protein FrondiHNR_12385 [Lysinibacter sp. HNR]